MKKAVLFLLGPFVLGLAGCGRPVVAPAVTVELAATQAAAATSLPTLRPPAPAATVAVTPAGLSRKSLTLTTEDGAQLAATEWGGGSDWVILSSNGDGRSERWRPLAEALAGQGFAALTYDWRGTNAAIPGKDDWQLAVTDARAALDHARTSGAKRLVLVGGSLGGITSIKLGSEPDVAGVVALGTPYRTAPLGITPAEVKAIRGATLFMSSEADSIVPAAEVQWLHDQVDGPRELHIYSGGAHGVDLLASQHRDDVIVRIARFVAAALPKIGAGQGDDRAARWRNEDVSWQRCGRGIPNRSDRATSPISRIPPGVEGTGSGAERRGG